MKICPNCHRKNSASAKFCRYCGTKLTNVKPQGLTVDGIKCPNCGKLNAKTAKFCRYCGTKLHVQVASSNVNHDKTTRSSNHKPAEKSPNYLICPNCGTKNSLSTKFCVYCGYDLVNKKMPERTTTSNQSSQQWAQAQQSLNAFKNYSNNYFKWFMDTLRNPLERHAGGPYFGLVSGGLVVLLIWIAERISKGSTNVLDSFDNLYNAYSPLKFVIDNTSNPSPMQILIMSFVSIILYIVMTYLGVELVSPQQPNFFKVCNHFANFMNIGVIVSILLVIGAMMNMTTLTWIFGDIIEDAFEAGVVVTILSHRSYQIKLCNSAFIAVTAIVLCDLIQPILGAIICTL